MSKHIVLGFFFVLWWGMMWCIHPADADTPHQTQLNFGDSVEGTITNAQFRQLYNFEGRAGQVITIQMTRQSGNLDPYLLLLTQSGDLVTYSDDANNRDAEIVSQALPRDGSYTIIATRFGHEHGTTEGDYLLKLDTVSDTVAVPSPTTQNFLPDDDNSVVTTTTAQSGVVLLRYGDEVLGHVNAQQPYTIYRFAAQRGDVINLSMTRINGDLDPLLDLFDPNGNYLLSGDDEQDTLNAMISNYTVPMDGVYYIQATRYGRLEGSSTGLYSLRIDAVPVEQLGTRPSNARVLSLPATVNGSISEEYQTRFFQIEARRGDIVSVVATRTAGDLLPRVNVLRDDLAQIATSVLSDDELTATIGGVTIQVDGIYFITVTRADGTEGETTGDFTLLVERRPSVGTSENLEIVYGGQVIGTINDDTVQESFVFMGKAGDLVTISMIRTNGDLDALLTLRDADGKQIAVNDDGYGDGRKDALIQDYRLPADGLYVIEASRYRRVEGDTSGDYILRLNAVPTSSEN
ncbi:MAG: hypothetical protein CUN55_00440 [Phototrophicales bacterium]|nr:MAG: hypothetical protein CUN55_00440 [Phototrophicales bacterium]